MKSGIIITLPQSDDVTEYLTIFSKDIINACNTKEIKIFKLHRENANRKNFEKSISSYDYSFIILNGHGGDNCVTGHKEEEILIKGDNDWLMVGRIVYARSCYAGAGLGNYFKENSGCFIGYELPFMFLSDKTDNIARIFFDTSNRVPIGLINGQTTKVANDNSKKSMLKAIKKALIKGDKDSQNIAAILWNNYEGQVLIGEENLCVRK